MKNIRIKTLHFILLLILFLAFVYATNPKVKGIATSIAQSIFSNNTTILLAGDTMLGRSVMTESLKRDDPQYPFEKTKDKLKQADIVFLNLENPIIDNCPQTNTGMIFCADPQMIKGLTEAGVDVVTLANNHSKNYGQKGLEETIQRLKNEGIKTVGYGNLVIKTLKGIDYGFLGFDFLTKEPKQSDYELIKQSKEKVDILIAGVHWGVEYADKSNKYQKEWAEKMIENGVDIIAGHHPHWVQEKQEINGKPIYYSLGNFIFDQMWSEKTKQGLVVELTFKNGELSSTSERSTYMSSWAQPEFVE